MNGHVYWITGYSGTGKTTIGTRLYYRLKKEHPHIVLLDGDIIKRLFGVENVDYSKDGRRRRAFQYSELCKLLAYQGVTVVCCTISMFDDVRDWNRKNIPNYTEIFIDVDLTTVSKRDAKGLYNQFTHGKDAMVGVAYEAELPKNPDVIIVNKMNDGIDLYVDQILQSTVNKKQIDRDYWNEYYRSGLAPSTPSDFAKFAYGYMKPNRKLIDLGCGNGRDSIFFCMSGLKVTAIDSSIDAIRAFDEKLPLFAVCDDFVAAKVLFCVDYDYCYSRWSIHAINQNQQSELLLNVYNSLKKGGLFFIEARTINDAKYGLGECVGTNEFIYDNHYRRFIDPNLLTEQLTSLGFEIEYCEQSDAFSVVGSDCPTLVRVIAKKV